MTVPFSGSSRETQLAMAGLALVAEASRKAIPISELLERTRRLIGRHAGSGRVCLHLLEGELYGEEVREAALGGCCAHDHDPTRLHPLKHQGETFAFLHLMGGEWETLTDTEADTLQMLGQSLYNALEGERVQHELVARESIITLLAHAIEAKDSFTRGHVERVRDYAHRLGRSLGLEGEDLQALGWAALLHDVGKIGVPEAILNKPARLTQEEFAVVQEHPAIGNRILSRLKGRFADKILLGVLQHHERFDGNGYPHGKQGGDIALIARIISVVDMFDAMTSDRPYRDAVSHQDAVAHLRRVSGLHLDPELVEHFIGLIESEGFLKG